MYSYVTFMLHLCYINVTSMLHDHICYIYVTYMLHWMVPGWSLDAPSIAPWMVPSRPPASISTATINALATTFAASTFPLLRLYNYLLMHPRPDGRLDKWSGHLTSEMHTCAGTRYYSKDPCGTYSNDALRHTLSVVFVHDVGCCHLYCLR